MQYKAIQCHNYCTCTDCDAIVWDGSQKELYQKSVFVSLYCRNSECQEISNLFKIQIQRIPLSKFVQIWKMRLYIIDVSQIWTRAYTHRCVFYPQACQHVFLGTQVFSAVDPIDAEWANEATSNVKPLETEPESYQRSQWLQDQDVKEDEDTGIHDKATRWNLIDRWFKWVSHGIPKRIDKDEPNNKLMIFV